MTEAEGFSIGICASDSAASLLPLLSLVRKEDFGESLVMQKLVVVASGCPSRVVSRLETEAKADDRIVVVSESQRRGKAEAVNEIIDNSSGEYLVFLNADAIPARGAICGLLNELSKDVRAGCISARPVFREGGGMLAQVLSLMWSAHNAASLKLNHASISNHSSDELLAVRRRFLTRLPPNLVNDGAYIGGIVKAGGHLVKFSQPAVVSISVPKRPAELVNQRRRIIFGHVQVWKKLGNPPRTVESLLFTNPVMGVRILVSLFAARPSLIPVLPFALVSEILSAILAMVDSVRSSTRHVVWKRFES